MRHGRAIPADLMSLLQAWTQGFCPLNTIERALSDLIDGRRSNKVQRVSTAMRKALGAPDVIDALAVMGLEAKPSTPAAREIPRRLAAS